jgi:hypothetical protein
MVAIEDWYSENPNVVVITNLDDIGQPYSCTQWGDRHLYYNDQIYPLMTDDGNQDILWGWLQTGGAFPSTAYIDHTMTVYYKANNPSFGPATATIDAMLNECGDLCTLSPPAALFDFVIDGNTVSFIDFSEFASEGWIIESWNWNFGDGNLSSEQNPVHTYSMDGNYEVSLTVTTDIGTESDVFTAEIQIGTLANIDISNPSDFGLLQNYPNPFNPSTTINYFVKESGNIKMDIYDINGKIIDEIIDGYQISGEHSINWMPVGLSSGMYYINLIQGSGVDQIKVMFIK